MKKSLQYVLIMSALGLQSGVILAQQVDTVGAEEIGRPAQGVAWTLSAKGMTDILASYKSRGDFDQEKDGRFIQSLMDKIQNQGANYYLTIDKLAELPYEERSVFYKACTYSPDGLRVVSDLPRETQKNYILEAAGKGIFENLMKLNDIQDVLVMAGNLEWNMYSRGFAPYIPEESRTKIVQILIGDTPTGLTRQSPQFTMGGFAGSVFVMPYNMRFGLIGREMLASNLIGPGGAMDLKGMLNDKKFPMLNQTIVVGSMLNTRQGRAVVAMADSVIRDRIVDVVYDIRKNNMVIPAFGVRVQLGLLQAQMEYNDVAIIGKNEKEAIVESLKKEMIKDPSISLYDKATFAKLLSARFLASKTNDEFSARLEKKIMTEAPKKIEVYLRDKNPNASEYDFELEATGAPEARRDQKTDGDDARKGIIKVKDLQKDIDADKKGVGFEVDEADIKVKEKTEKIKETK